MDFSTIDQCAKTLHRKTYREHVEYGTAGFRMRADALGFILFRMGIFAVLRSKLKNATIGLMITASHNAESDNGVKLIDPAGEMLEISWEKIATQLVNVEDSELVPILRRIIGEHNIDENAPATVIIGRDTRKSSPTLANAAITGVTISTGNALDFGVVTTPQLHYLVASKNKKGDYGEPTLDAYYLKLSKTFKYMRGNERNNGKYVAELYLDAANGVGAVAMKELQNRLGDTINVQIYNGGSGELNYKCGADYVKVQQTPPLNVPATPNVRCVSIDGDADRVVYYYIDEQNKFHLLDGDRIATLIAEYFKELLEQSNLTLQLGLVQTAYANRASTEYIVDVLKVPVACAQTGVKYLHQKALEFDIGIYFEANGHGTVVVKDSAIAILRDAANDTNLPNSERKAASKLVDTIEIINQVVGDALSDVLLVETILHAKGWDLATWKQCYDDLPSKQIKVMVKDRYVISTMGAEPRCFSPIGLQDQIDKLVARYPKGRAFIRPSGTENVVRVYTEGKYVSDVDKLVAEVALAVYKAADGIGPEPVVPYNF